MKNIYTSILFAGLCITAENTQAQTTAMNYAFTDCAGNAQEIYADLDAGKAVILEFFMTSCTPCVTAGGKLEAMKTDLLAEFPGMIKSYAFGFSNSYTCTTINNWVSTNGFTSIPSDSGAAQVAYYGGMGMPTIVILGGGTAHSVLGSPYIGFSTSDTTTMAADIRNSLNGTLGMHEENSPLTHLNVFPNPAGNEVSVSIGLRTAADVNIRVLDLTGRVVMPVLNEKNISGTLTRTIRTDHLPQGQYIIHTMTNGFSQQQKLNVIH